LTAVGDGHARGGAVATAPPPAPTWVVVLLIGLVACLTGLGLAVMAVAYPTIVEDFPDSSPAQLSWVTNIFPIVGAATLVPAGALADRYGRKRLLLIGVAAFAAGSCLAALADGPALLVLGRAVQSLGASAYTPAATALLIAAFPPARLSLAIGIWAVAGGVSSAAAPAIGGLAIEAGGWRWTFWMNVPVALLVLALGPRVFRESVADRTRAFPDPVGAVLIMGGISLVVLAVVQSDEWGWLGGRTVAALVGGGLVLAWLARRCARRPNPILELSLLREAPIGRANLGTVVFATSFFCLFFSLVFFFTTTWGWSPVRAGLASAPVSLFAGLVGLTLGPVAGRRGHRPFLLLGTVVYAGAAVWLWFTIDATPDYATLIPAEVLLGAGSGLVFPSFIAISVTGIAPARHAVASSVNFTTQRVGTSLGTALATTFLADVSLSGTAWLHRSMVVALVGAGAGFLVALRVDTRPPAVALRIGSPQG
jgi:EmrB/QacA subfamily drug resistance transporter